MFFQLTSFSCFIVFGGLTVFAAAVWEPAVPAGYDKPSSLHLSLFTYSLLCGPCDIAHHVLSGTGDSSASYFTLGAGTSSVGAVTIHPHHGGAKKTL